MGSPLGQLRLVEADGALAAVDFEPFPAELPPELADFDQAIDVLRAAVNQLRAYFAGDPSPFDLPLAPKGTAFQQEVWGATRLIPYGCRLSYGELAAELRRPIGASRAVGGALGRNPLPILIPCHRVVTADGHLGGYAGGSERKQKLLSLELVHKRQP